MARTSSVSHFVTATFPRGEGKEFVNEGFIPLNPSGFHNGRLAENESNKEREF